MRIVMMGTGGFAEPVFEALLACSYTVVGLVTQPDRSVGHERGSTRQVGKGMKNIALEHNVPVFQPESINTPEGVAALQAWQPELLVVAAYGQILSKHVLAVPKHGGINVHASLLPRYRGAAPIAWAIYHGETRTGVTIIQMSPKLDAGDILVQDAIDIIPDESAGELEARLAHLGARLAIQGIEMILALEMLPPDQAAQCRIKQDKSQMTKAPKLTKEHGLIDWSRDAEQVRNQIRAMQPWPTAYTFLRRQDHKPVRVIVQRAGRVVVSPSGPTHPIPGSVMTVEGEGLWIATGAIGVLEILELQPAGKRRMTAAEFLHGHPLPPGARFGPETP